MASRPRSPPSLAPLAQHDRGNDAAWLLTDRIVTLASGNGTAKMCAERVVSAAPGRTGGGSIALACHGLPLPLEGPCRTGTAIAPLVAAGSAGGAVSRARSVASYAALGNGRHQVRHEGCFGAELCATYLPLRRRLRSPCLPPCACLHGAAPPRERSLFASPTSTPLLLDGGCKRLIGS